MPAHPSIITTFDIWSGAKTRATFFFTRVTPYLGCTDSYEQHAPKFLHLDGDTAAHIRGQSIHIWL